LILLTLASPCVQANSPPHAVAAANILPDGSVQTHLRLLVGPTPGDTVSWTLRGSRSSDPDGDTLTYRWTCTDGNGNKCFNITVPNASDVQGLFPAGTYNFTLTVKDPSGATSTDTAQVKVQVDNTPPQVFPPDNAFVSVTETGGARAANSGDLNNFLFHDAYAQDPLGLQFFFTALPPQINGVDVNANTLFPLGPTTVTFRFADDFGNVGVATAEVTVVDLQPGDLFVGAGVDIGFGASSGLIYRIRNGQVSIYCESPMNGADPGYWPVPSYITVDSKGRVAFLAPTPFPINWKMGRCHQQGQSAERLANFFGGFADPAWPQPFPNRNVQVVKGLHLQRTKTLVIDDAVNGGAPTPVTEEKYIFAGGLNSSLDDNDRHSFSLSTNSLEWTEDEINPLSINRELPEMFYHGKIEAVTIPFTPINIPAPLASTYLAVSNTVRRVFRPLALIFTGSTPLGSFQVGLQLFGGDLELAGALANDVTGPVEGTGCPPHGGLRQVWPVGRIHFDQFLNVYYEKNQGLVLKSNHGGLPAWMGRVNEAHLNFDNLDDASHSIANPFNFCATEPIVDFQSLTPGYHFDPTTGEGMDPTRTAVSVDGVYATQPQTRRVVRLNPGSGLSEVATNLDKLWGIGAYPPQLGSVHYSTVLVRIDSPVEVVITDAHGRRLGAAQGQSINEFGRQGFDSGPQSHPRFYAINHPQPGTYNVQSVGTGTGPFTVHIYSADSQKWVHQHIAVTGMAAPGTIGKHDFVLDAAGTVTLANAAPLADAGADQTVTADASGNATVALSGAGSSDPDGDALTFTWGGPFGVLAGATVNATLPVGVHALTLTVDDGKGGRAKDTLLVTVTGAADTTPPLLTLPSSITREATSPSGALVVYPASALDAVDGPVAVICVPASGGTFPLGQTPVQCTASDTAGNSAQASFAVFVVDTTLPTLTLPANITVTTSNAAGTVVNYTATASDAVTAVTPVCAPASGSTFAVGATTVHCSVADAAGNRRSGSFTVTVNYTVPQAGTPRLNGTIATSGRDPTGYFIDLRQQNIGTGDARNVRVSLCLIATRYGSGQVTLATALPVLFGDIAVGSSATRRLYLNVPATVKQFFIAEIGGMENTAGTGIFFTSGQTVTVSGGTTGAGTTAGRAPADQTGSMTNSQKPLRRM
jgi:hypothetical protein